MTQGQKCNWDDLVDTMRNNIKNLVLDDSYDDAVLAVDAELTRLTEKYSQKCERCGGDGHHLLEDCPVCHGTGRVWMMGVDEVRLMFCQSKGCNCLSHTTVTHILEGEKP